MAVTQFNLANNVTVLQSEITDISYPPRGTVYTSADQANGTGQDLSTGIRVIVVYHDVQSSDGTAGVQAVIEGKGTDEDGNYYTLGYQFDEYRSVGVEHRRQIVVEPGLFWQDAGIDNIVYIAGEGIENISNQQGILPLTWRVRIRVFDANNTFTSVRFSIYGERFNRL